MNNPEHPVLTQFQILSDAGYIELLEKMTTVLHQDARVCKGTLQMRVQKCFAIKVSLIFVHISHKRATRTRSEAIFFRESA